MNSYAGDGDSLEEACGEFDWCHVKDANCDPVFATLYLDAGPPYISPCTHSPSLPPSPPSPLSPPPRPPQPFQPPLPPWSPAPEGMVLATSAEVLQELLLSAAAGAPLTVFLPEGLTLVIDGVLVVNAGARVSLTSAGAGAMLDGGGAAAALFVVRDGGSLSLTRIHMQNVRNSPDAGITVGGGAFLSLRHSSMSDMTSAVTAGCIQAEGAGGGNILIEDSVRAVNILTYTSHA